MRAIRAWQKRGSNYGFKKSSSVNSNSKVVSNQHDYATIYRKKRPRRGRRARAFQKRKYRQYKSVTNVLTKSLGTKSIVYNTAFTNTFATGGQFYGIVHLFGASGTNVGSQEYGTRDLYEMCINDASINTGAEKFILNSGVLDVTFSNTSDHSLEVDVYYFTYKKNAKVFTNMDATFTAAAGDTSAAGSGFGSLTIGDRGVTPFQLPVVAAMGVKVLKKTKHFVPAGGYFAEFFKSTRKKILNLRDIYNVNNTQYAMGGITVTCMFLIKKVVGVNPTATSTWHMGATRTYNYKVNSENADEDGYVTGL